VDLECPRPPLSGCHAAFVTLEPPARDHLQPQPRRSRHHPEPRGAHVRQPLRASQLEVVADSSKPRFAVDHEADRVLAVRLPVDPALNPSPPTGSGRFHHVTHAVLRSPSCLGADPRVRWPNGLSKLPSPRCLSRTIPTRAVRSSERPSLARSRSWQRHSAASRLADNREVANAITPVRATRMLKAVVSDGLLHLADPKPRGTRDAAEAAPIVCLHGPACMGCRVRRAPTLEVQRRGVCLR
jgi:hypothetical protein